MLLNINANMVTSNGLIPMITIIVIAILKLEICVGYGPPANNVNIGPAQADYGVNPTTPKVNLVNPQPDYWWQKLNSPFGSLSSTQQTNNFQSIEKTSPCQTLECQQVYKPVIKEPNYNQVVPVKYAKPSVSYGQVNNGPLYPQEVTPSSPISYVSPTVAPLYVSPPSAAPSYASPSSAAPSYAVPPSAAPSYAVPPSPSYAVSEPVPYTGPLNTTPYPGCAAALKCVADNYCTIDGIMSDVPVVLTKDALLNRVPLSECLDVSTGIIGKCCRDPNYKDPWPADLPHVHHEGDDHGHHEHVHEHDHGHVVTSSPPTESYTIKKPIGVFQAKPPAFPVNSSPYGSVPNNYPEQGSSQPYKPVYQEIDNYIHPTKQDTIVEIPQKTVITSNGVQQSSFLSNSYETSEINKPVAVGVLYPTPLPVGSQPTNNYQFSEGPKPVVADTYYPQQPIIPQVNEQPASIGIYRIPEVPKPVAADVYYPQLQSGPFPSQQPEPTPVAVYKLPEVTKPEPAGGFYSPTSLSTHQVITSDRVSTSQLFVPSHTGVNFPNTQINQPQPGPLVQQSFKENEILPPNPFIQRFVPAQTCGIKTTDEIPWHAEIYSIGSKAVSCGGAIIAENAVITAAHCLENVDSQTIQIKIGSGGAYKITSAAAIVRHDNYNSQTYSKDLAIVLLKEPIAFDNYVQKICLKTDNSYSSKSYRECLATTQSSKGQLQKIRVEIFSYGECDNKLKNSYLGKYFNLDESFSCVSTPTNADLCQIKFGDPISCDRGNGQYELAGVKSWDLGCKDYSKTSIFSNDDVAWISSILAKSYSQLTAIEQNYLKSKFQGETLEGVNIQEKPGFALGYGK